MGAQVQKVDQDCPVQKSISAMHRGDFWHPLRPFYSLLWYLSSRDVSGAAVVAVEDGVVDKHARVMSTHIHVRIIQILVV